MDKKHDIFVSYSRHDTNVVNEFVDRLEREGFSVWIDRDGIESGDAFKRIILQAIKNSAVVLFFSSQHSNQSGWTAKEIGVAVKYQKTVIPVLLDGSNFNEEVEFDLINLDFIDYQDASLRGMMMDRLVKSLKAKIPNPMGQKKAEEARLKAEAVERARLEQERRKKEDAERKAREAAERERKAQQATAIAQTPLSDKPASAKKKTLWIALGAAAALALLLLLLLKSKKEEPVVVDPDTETYQACRTVQDYRRYIAYYGLHAEYYAEAKDFIDRYVADSTQRAEDSLRIVRQQEQLAQQQAQQQAEAEQKTQTKEQERIEAAERKAREEAMQKELYDAAIAEGKRLYNTEKYDEAKKFFVKAKDCTGINTHDAIEWIDRCDYKIRQTEQERVAAEKAAEAAAMEANAEEYFRQGQKCYYDGNYEKAVEWYRKSSNLENANGQTCLGRMYEKGLGVNQDYREAVKWYRKAAEKGNALGQANLGYMYLAGYGVEQDYQEALKWCRKAVGQGNDYGQVNLAWMYRDGKGVAQNYQEALKLYRKAAEQGNVIGQTNVGYMYENGLGVTKDYQEAIKWYRKAAQQGDDYSQKALKRLGER